MTPTVKRGRGRPRKPLEEHAAPLSVSMRPEDMERLGAIMRDGESPTQTIRRVLVEAYERIDLID